MIRAKVAVWLFAAVSIVSFVTALIPVLKGGQANAVFLGNGVLWLAIAVASAKRARRASKGPPAAQICLQPTVRLSHRCLVLFFAVFEVLVVCSQKSNR